MKRPKPVLTLKIGGPGIRPGTLPVPDLLRICQATQEAVNRQAEAMRGGFSLRPGPATSEVQEECTLVLAGMEKGSTVLPFDFAKRQQALPLPGTATFGADVINKLVATVKELETVQGQHAFEPGVLDSLSRKFTRRAET